MRAGRRKDGREGERLGLRKEDREGEREKEGGRERERRREGEREREREYEGMREREGKGIERMRMLKYSQHAFLLIKNSNSHFISQFEL